MIGINLGNSSPVAEGRRGHVGALVVLFHVSGCQVLWFIRNETGTAGWSRAMKIFCEAKKNKVIIFDQNTLLWRGYLYGDKSAKLPTKKSFKNPKTGNDRLTYTQVADVQLNR